MNPLMGNAVSDPTAADKIRIAADQEDDGATEMMIQKERRDTEYRE